MRALQKIKNPETLVWLGLGLWWIVNLVQAGCTELADDEAYYHMFAGRLAWGYFDHPPMTALLVHLGGFLGGGDRCTLFLHSPTTHLPVRTLADHPPPGRRRFASRIVPADRRPPMPILQLYGFIAVPDGPLMLFTALFLWSYKYFTERSNWLACPVHRSKPCGTGLQQIPRRAGAPVHGAVEPQIAEKPEILRRLPAGGPCWSSPICGGSMPTTGYRCAIISRDATATLNSGSSRNTC